MPWIRGKGLFVIQDGGVLTDNNDRTLTMIQIYVEADNGIIPMIR